MFLKINEIFKSIQGESSYSGLPCVFIRLSGCNLKCKYCDTAYASKSYKEKSCEEILHKISLFNCNLVEVTGGEPLIQEETPQLISKLCRQNYTVLVETNGTISIKNLDTRAIIIMDIKCPSSGESNKFLYENIDYIKKTDELKFVISNKNDYEFAKEIILDLKLEKKVNIIFSSSHNNLSVYKTLAANILRDNLNARIQVQLHKIIEVK